MYKNGFGIKYILMVDVPQNQTKPEYLEWRKFTSTWGY